MRRALAPRPCRSHDSHFEPLIFSFLARYSTGAPSSQRGCRPSCEWRGSGSTGTWFGLRPSPRCLGHTYDILGHTVSTPQRIPVERVACGELCCVRCDRIRVLYSFGNTQKNNNKRHIIVQHVVVVAQRQLRAAHLAAFCQQSQSLTLPLTPSWGA
eukprot:scaffold34401_cov129-Isochrysis_galbana.AAC.2